YMEGARGDEQDVIRLHRSVFGRHRRDFNERKEVPLHTLARNTRAQATLARGNLVDLVEKDDAVILRSSQRTADYLVLIEQLVGFVIDQELVGIANGGLDGLGAPAAHRLLQHVVNVQHADISAGKAGNLEAAKAAARIGHLDLDLLVVKLPVPELLAETVARGWTCGAAHKCLQHALLSVHVRARLNALAHLLAREPDGNLHEIAHDLLHVAADLAHFGKLGGLHLDEGGAGELGEPARNLSLAHAGRADHQNVLRHHLLAQSRLELLPAPAVAKRDSHRTLCLALAADVAVEL